MDVLDLSRLQFAVTASFHIATCAWAAGWGAIFTLCIGVFGEAVALVAVTATVLATSAVWYATHRRDKRKGRA